MFFQHLTNYIEYLCQIVVGHPLQNRFHQIVIRELLQVELDGIFIGLSVQAIPHKTIIHFHKTMGISCHSGTPVSLKYPVRTGIYFHLRFFEDPDFHIRVHFRASVPDKTDDGKPVVFSDS